MPAEAWDLTIRPCSAATESSLRNHCHVDWFQAKSHGVAKLLMRAAVQFVKAALSAYVEENYRGSWICVDDKQETQDERLPYQWQVTYICVRRD